MKFLTNAFSVNMLKEVNFALVRFRKISHEDVPEDAWYREAVEWAWRNGITKGRDASHFDPDTPITRAELAAMLYRMEGGGKA